MILNNKKIFNLTNFLIYIFLFFSIVLLLYTHYKSYFVFNSFRLNHYLIYYFFSTGSIIFFSVLLFFNVEFKKNTLLFLFTLIFITYLSEVLVRAIYKGSSDSIKENKRIRENRAKVIFEKYGKVIDIRSPIQVQKELKEKGTDVSLLVTPYRMIENEIKIFDDKDDENNNEQNSKKILPLSGLSKKLYIGGSETGEYKFYTTDRYGFNNQDDDWDKEIYITLIGDSFIHGGYLNFENNFVGTLKKISNKTVLGLAQPNNGPLLELATLKEYIKVINPKIILWMYYEGNDLIEIIEEKKSKTLNKYFSKNFTQDLIKKQKSIERSYSIFVDERILKLDLAEKKIDTSQHSSDDDLYTKILSIFKLKKIRAILFTNLFARIKDREYTKSTKFLKDVLIEAKRETDILNAKLYFVYLPSSTRFLDNNHILRKNDFFRQDVLNIVDNLNIELIDIYEKLFKYHQNPLSFYHFSMHSHYNKKAVEQISQEIYKQVLDN